MNMNKELFVGLITLSRILIVIPLFFISSELYVFIAVFWSSLSDFFDGFLARKWSVSTSFGAKFDQYADKITNTAFLFIFWQQNLLSIYFVALIILREFLIMIFRYFKLSENNSNFLAKTKTFFLYCLFVNLSIEQFLLQNKFNVKTLLIFLVIFSSWLSFLLSIKVIKGKVVQFFSTSLFSSLLFKRGAGTISTFVIFILLFYYFESIELEYKIGLLTILMLLHFNYYPIFIDQFEFNTDDPNIYTLDETIAIVLAWIYFKNLTPLNSFILFIIFRFFDIYKPFGIRYIENQLRWSPEFRNIADDILAMFYSICLFSLIKIYVA